MIDGGLGLYRPSCNTGQGVLCCGEDKECLALYSEGNRFLVAFFCVWGEVLIGPLVTALKPEAGRSIPGQDEVALTSDGGPNGCCSAKHSFDLGIVVKGQSRPATAGSTRNDS